MCSFQPQILLYILPILLLLFDTLLSQHFFHRLFLLLSFHFPLMHILLVLYLLLLFHLVQLYMFLLINHILYIRLLHHLVLQVLVLYSLAIQYTHIHLGFLLLFLFSIPSLLNYLDNLSLILSIHPKFLLRHFLPLLQLLFIPLFFYCALMLLHILLNVFLLLDSLL